jgi:hypothetical protein
MNDYDLYIQFFTRVDEPVVVFDKTNQTLCYGKIRDFNRRVHDNTIIFVDLEIENANGKIVTVNTGFNVNYTLLRIVRLTSKYLMSDIKNMSFEQLMKECIMPEDKFYRVLLGDVQNWDERYVTKQGITLNNCFVNNIVSSKSFKCCVLEDDLTRSNVQTKYNLKTGISCSKNNNFYIDVVVFRKPNCYDIDWLHEIEKIVIVDKNLKYNFRTLNPDILHASKKMRAQMEFVQDWLNSREFLLNEERFDISLLDAIDE